MFRVIVLFLSFQFALLNASPLMASADAFVEDLNFANVNFGNTTCLEVQQGKDGGFTRVAYITFDLSSLAMEVANSSQIESAELTLTVCNEDSGRIDVILETVTENWSEGNITWINKPNATSQIARITEGASNGTQITLDILQQAKEAFQSGGKLSIKISGVITMMGNSFVSFFSRDSDYGPTLNITYNSGQTSQNQTVVWTDGQYNYSVGLQSPQCGTLLANNLTVTFTSSHPLEYVTFMYQFNSHCDYVHCDCSAPVDGISTGGESKVFIAQIPPPAQVESSVMALMLFKASEWNNRAQYPGDALPHQFVKFDIGCGGSASRGPCDPNSCWEKLGQKGCTDISTQS